MACYCLHAFNIGDQFGEATMWPVHEHSVYDVSAAIISLELRVAAKLVCGGVHLLTPHAKYEVSIVDFCCVKFLTAKITSNFNMPKTISSKLWPAAK